MTEYYWSPWQCNNILNVLYSVCCFFITYIIRSAYPSLLKSGAGPLLLQPPTPFHFILIHTLLVDKNNRGSVY